MRFIHYFGATAAQQIFGLIALVLVAIGSVNDVYSFVTAPWFPRWGFQAAAILFIYAAFQVVAYRNHRAISRLEDKLQSLLEPTPNPAPSPIGAPNMSLALAVKWVEGSTWAKEHKADQAAALVEMRDKLTLGRLTAFARIVGDPNIMAIPDKHWRGYYLDLLSGGAKDSSGALVLEDVQFDRHLVASNWRPYRKPGSSWGA